MQGRGGRWQSNGAVVLLIAATLLVYGRIGVHEFAGFDDSATLYQNPRLNPPSWENLAYFWSHPELHIYIPMTYTAWSGLAAVAELPQADENGIRLNPWVFHSASVVVHVINAVLVFHILRRVIGAVGPALAGALLFALHPVQVETVAWASGMKDLLFALFGLGAVLEYVRFLEGSAGGSPVASRPSPGRVQGSGFRVQGSERRSGAGGRHELPPGDPGPPTEHSSLHYAAGTVLLILSMLSKPTAMVIPAVAGAIALGVYGKGWKWVLRTVGPWLVLSGLCAVVARAVQTGARVPNTDWWQRPLVAGHALAFYLGKLIWPGALAPDYGWTPAAVMSHVWAWWIWIVPAGLALALWLFRRRMPGVVTGAAIALIGLSPLLGILSFDFQWYSTVSDHYLYLPMLGVALAAAWGLQRAWGRRAVIAAAFVLVALGIRSFVQAGHWQSDGRIWGHTVAVTPWSWVAQYELSHDLADALRLHEAERHAREAARLKPDFANVRLNLARVLEDQGKCPEAIDQAREVIRLRIEPTGAPAEIGSAYAIWARCAGRLGRVREQVEVLQNAVRELPQSQGARRMLDEALRKQSSSRPANSQ